MTTQDKIRNMQKFLNNHYDAGLVEDGIYGPKTQKAVKEMQRQLNITDDGWWGTDTQKAVAKAYYGSVPTFSNIRYNGKQKTTRNDLAFMYKNSSADIPLTATTEQNTNSTAVQGNSGIPPYDWGLLRQVQNPIRNSTAIQSNSKIPPYDWRLLQQVQNPIEMETTTVPRVITNSADTKTSPNYNSSTISPRKLTREQAEDIYYTKYVNKPRAVLNVAGKTIYETPVNVRDTAPSGIKEAHARDRERKKEKLITAIMDRGY